MPNKLKNLLLPIITSSKEKKKYSEAFSAGKELSISSSFAEGQCCMSELENTNKAQII